MGFLLRVARLTEFCPFLGIPPFNPNYLLFSVQSETYQIAMTADKTNEHSHRGDCAKDGPTADVISETGQTPEDY